MFSVNDKFIIDKLFWVYIPFCISMNNFRHDNDDIHCFEINTADRSRGGYVFGSRGLSERRVWLQKLAEGLSIRFGPKIISDYTRLGWAYIKEGTFLFILY